MTDIAPTTANHKLISEGMVPITTLSELGKCVGSIMRMLLLPNKRAKNRVFSTYETDTRPAQRSCEAY